jgi:hypothetical protein
VFTMETRPCAATAQTATGESKRWCVGGTSGRGAWGFANSQPHILPSPRSGFTPAWLDGLADVRCTLCAWCLAIVSRPFSELSVPLHCTLPCAFPLPCRSCLIPFCIPSCFVSQQERLSAPALCQIARLVLVSSFCRMSLTHVRAAASSSVAVLACSDGP